MKAGDRISWRWKDAKSAAFKRWNDEVVREIDETRIRLASAPGSDWSTWVNTNDIEIAHGKAR